MKRFIVMLLALLVASLVSAQDSSESDPVLFREAPPSTDSFVLETVAEGLRRPLFVTHANDDSSRIFIMEQGGVVYVQGDDGERTTFLDISGLVSPAANSANYTERGLLGLVFAPDYAESGEFYVNYTNQSGTTILARYQVSADADVADANSAQILFEQDQPFPNHNGGHLAFGSDGYLYMALGDGGAAGDPLAAGQNPQTLLGSIIRIDVSGGGDYLIPEDNPFVTGEDGAPEVWSFGWRNPWRFSFDRETGDMYIGDVGQNQWEEINFEPRGIGGQNYGWNAFEANTVFNSNVRAPRAVDPVADYNHSQGCSVTGGYIYRGSAIPDLAGVYFYGDYCSGNIWYAYRDTEGNWQSELFLETGMQISSFGEDGDGELYVVNYQGAVLKFAPAN